MNPICRLRFLFAILLTILMTAQVKSQGITSEEIDQLAERTLKAFDVPGIAVGVVKDGKLIHARGYGVRSLTTRQKTDENTLFAIASNSKAFTAAALGILVEEKKLKWDDRVIDFIPEFRMYDPYVTAHFTIRDLLTHRSGLGLGAGDLMIWPDSATFSKQEIIHNLRFLKPVSDFRTKYDYDNLLYIVAGEVVARVSGTSWENFVETRIMQPLQMNQSAASYHHLKDRSNLLDAHAPVNGRVQVIPKSLSDVANAAGGIYTNIVDMSKWAIALLNSGKIGDNPDRKLFSKAVLEEMWTPQTIIPVRGSNSYNTHFGSYGLGWFISDVKGYKQLSHTGGLAGIVTQFTLIPELQLGIIVFTNQQQGAAFSAITNTIKDRYLGIAGPDWVQSNLEKVRKNEEEAQKITGKIWQEIESAQNNSAKPDWKIYSGAYTDNWFGKIVITEKNGKLWFRSLRSPKLCGEMLFYKGNTFVVKWNDRSMDADAFALFSLDENGKATGLHMKAISPLTDFSFDFHDLDFQRANE